MALPVETLCMGCADEKCDFKPMAMQRRPLGDSDVLIDMKYCGICHTDLHTAAGHLSVLGMKRYPCVPGHELSGVCTAVGAKVTRVKVGDQVGVGCMVDSCLNCSNCKRGEEQKCTKQVGTYNAKDNGSGRAATYPAGGHTLGGVFVCVISLSFSLPISLPVFLSPPLSPTHTHHASLFHLLFYASSNTHTHTHTPVGMWVVSHALLRLSFSPYLPFSLLLSLRVSPSLPPSFSSLHLSLALSLPPPPSQTKPET